MRYKIPLQVIELESNNYHLIVDSQFYDGSNRKWVVDTGASKTVFDKNLELYFSVLENESEEIHSAGIGEVPLETGLGCLNTFFIGKLKVENFNVALLDLSHINKLYSKATNFEVCGLIGSDFLKKHQAVIDYKRGKLILSV